MSDKVTLRMFAPAREAQQYEVEIDADKWQQWVNSYFFDGPAEAVDVRSRFSDCENIDPFNEYLEGFTYMIDDKGVK